MNRIAFILYWNMRYYVLVILMLVAIPINAQSARPYWIKQTPNQADDYYYRVGVGKGRTEDLAESKAIANLVYESVLAKGIPVDVSQLDSLSNISDIATISHYYKIPINIVCKYTDRYVRSDNMITVFVLAQVSKRASPIPDFKTFDCDTQQEIE